MSPASRKVAPSRLTSIFTENLSLKLTALVLSIVLFSIVHTDQDAQRSFLVDVVALLPPPSSDKMLTGELPHQVKVTLRGSRSRINDMSRDDFLPIQMDLRDTDRRYFYFELDSLDVGGNVQVVQIEPASVPLTWAVSAERKVPIKPRLRGEAPRGFVVKQPVLLSPPSITIRGPEAAVNAITEVYTEVIMVEGLTPGAHDPRVPLQPLRDDVVYMDDVAVQALITIEPQVEERTLRKLDVSIVGDMEASLRPDQVSVTLRGASSTLAVLDPNQVIPVIYLSRPDAGVGTRARKVQLQQVPEGVELVRISPESVLARPRP